MELITIKTSTIGDLHNWTYGNPQGNSELLKENATITRERGSYNPDLYRLALPKLDINFPVFAKGSTRASVTVSIILLLFGSEELEEALKKLTDIRTKLPEKHNPECTIPNGTVWDCASAFADTMAQNRPEEQPEEAHWKFMAVIRKFDMEEEFENQALPELYQAHSTFQHTHHDGYPTEYHDQSISSYHVVLPAIFGDCQ